MISFLYVITDRRMKIMIKFMLHGCNGKMGRMITEIVKGEENAAIAAGVDSLYRRTQ